MYDYEEKGDWDELYEEQGSDDYEIDLDDYEASQDMYLIRRANDEEWFECYPG